MVTFDHNVSIADGVPYGPDGLSAWLAELVDARAVGVVASAQDARLLAKSLRHELVRVQGGLGRTVEANKAHILGLIGGLLGEELSSS